MDLRQRTRRALEDARGPNSPAAIEGYAKNLRDQMVDCGKTSDQSLGLFTVVAFTWLLLRSASLGKISVLGLEIQNTEIAALALPPVAAFMFYRFACFWSSAAIADVVLDEIMMNRSPELANQGLNDLLTYPSMLTLDFALSQVDTQSGFMAALSSAWSVLLFLVMLGLPAMFLVWTSYSAITGSTVGLPWALGSSVLALALAARAVVAVIHGISL